MFLLANRKHVHKTTHKFNNKRKLQRLATKVCDTLLKIAITGKIIAHLKDILFKVIQYKSD